MNDRNGIWLRKWLEHHAAHLICGEHVERSAEDWHISQNLGSNVSTQSSTNLCSARDLCSAMSNIPFMLLPDMIYSVILIHAMCSLRMCKAGITELLWTTYDLFFFVSTVCFSWDFILFACFRELFIDECSASSWSSEPFAPCCVASRGPPICGKEAFQCIPHISK